MDEKVSFSFSKSPEILRAYQRDDEYKMMLRFMIVDALEFFVNYRLLSKYDSEIKLGSDFIYYLLTTLRGKQTLGEEYCSILPVSIQSEKFPSPIRRLIYCLLNIIGPYFFNRLIRKYEQPLNEYVVDQNNKLQDNQKSTFKDILKVQLLNLLPALYNVLTKQVNQLHLALFFLWGKYYEISKRVSGIRYKYVQGKENQHMIEYLRPGRFIMAQLLIQVIIFSYRVIKTVYQSYQQYQKLERKRMQQRIAQQLDNSNPQEDGKSQNEEEQQEENNEQDQCILCYGPRIYTTATACGHLFCWDCIQTSLKVKQECPSCREPCTPQKLVMIYNY